MDKQLKVEQIAEILGLAEDTVRDYFQASRFPGGYKLNWEWRLSEFDLARWIEFKKDPETFIEAELAALRATAKFRVSIDLKEREYWEKELVDKWEQTRGGKHKKPSLKG